MSDYIAISISPSNSFLSAASIHLTCMPGAHFDILQMPCNSVNQDPPQNRKRNVYYSTSVFLKECIMSPVGLCEQVFRVMVGKVGQLAPCLFFHTCRGDGGIIASKAWIFFWGGGDLLVSPAEKPFSSLLLLTNPFLPLNNSSWVIVCICEQT